MPAPIRVTGPLLDVLVQLLQADQTRSDLHGWSIMNATKRSGPTVYGVLDRLEDCEWLTSYWEKENPEPGKPRRRLYRLTPQGRDGALGVVAERRPAALRDISVGDERPVIRRLAPGGAG